MKQIHNYNRADGVNVVVTDTDRNLTFEMNEEDGYITLSVIQGDQVVATEDINLDEVLE